MQKNEILDWEKLGNALRESAMDAHDGNLPPVDIAYSFLLENPECFGEGDEWPDSMPSEPPIELIAAYYAAGDDRPKSQLARVCWASRSTWATGHGEPMPRATAEAWVSYANELHPDLQHRVEPIVDVPCPYCLEYSRGSDGSCVCDKPECRRKSAEAEALVESLRPTTQKP